MLKESKLASPIESKSDSLAKLIGKQIKANKIKAMTINLFIFIKSPYLLCIIIICIIL